jgi:hypothetical protein
VVTPPGDSSGKPQVPSPVEPKEYDKVEAPPKAYVPVPTPPPPKEPSADSADGDGTDPGYAGDSDKFHH